MMQTQRLLRSGAIALVTMVLAIGLAGEFYPNPIQGWGTQRAIAQQVSQTQSPRRLDPRQVWRQVYERLPDFPLENTYISNETGEMDPDNTLASRLISYHLYVQNRLPIFRLDWKLTLADYLGVNKSLDPSTYPGNSFLKENPMEGDRAVIASLNRQQRDELIGVLVRIFNPSYDSIHAPPPPPPASPAPPPTSPSNPPPLPEAGDADLLKL